MGIMVSAFESSFPKSPPAKDPAQRQAKFELIKLPEAIKGSLHADMTSVVGFTLASTCSPQDIANSLEGQDSHHDVAACCRRCRARVLGRMLTTQFQCCIRAFAVWLSEMPDQGFSPDLAGPFVRSTGLLEAGTLYDFKKKEKKKKRRHVDGCFVL